MTPNFRLIKGQMIDTEDFLDWDHRPDEILIATFMLALEIEFESALHICNEGYETGDNYVLPQLLNKPDNIYSVPSVAEASFNHADYQEPMIPTSPSTPKQRPVEFPLHLITQPHLQQILMMMKRGPSLHHPLMNLVWSEDPTLDRLMHLYGSRQNQKQVILECPPFCRSQSMHQYSKRNLWIAQTVIHPMSSTFLKKYSFRITYLNLLEHC